MNFTKIFEFESLIGDVYDIFKYEDLEFNSYKKVKKCVVGVDPPRVVK